MTDTTQHDQQGWITSSLTEQRNAATMQIDTLDTLSIVAAIGREDISVPLAVAREAEQIALLADVVVERLQQGGRLIYIGAGTSGRLGMLDAAECPPTFGISPDLVIARIAGGLEALNGAIESVEDDAGLGARDIHDLHVNQQDVVLGIAASGRTPYVLGAIAAARELGAYTAGLACTHPSPLAAAVKLMIAPLVGPEVIAGSTRMKAGTAQKLVLNTLSTTVMIRLGKTFSNLMVDVQATNAKLRLRAATIVAEATSLPLEAAQQVLDQAHGEVKTAILMTLAGVGADAARHRLAESQGHVRQALEGMANE